MKEFTEAKRPRVLDLLKVHGPQNIPTLAGRLGFNYNAVRQKLDTLQREGLVKMREQRQAKGRPTHVWFLTPLAEALFPQAYGTMVVTLLRQIRDDDGEIEIEKLFSKRARELAGEYRTRLKKSAKNKWKALAKIREEEGYMAQAVKGELVEHHCPIASIAGEFPQACKYEHQLFEQVLGKPLERTEHIASGGHACRYRPA